MSKQQVKGKLGLCCCCMELVCSKKLWKEYKWMGKTEVYGEIIKECFKVMMPKSQSGQDQICEVCITRLRDAARFRLQVLQCQEKMQHQTICRPVLVELETDMKPIKAENSSDFENFDDSDGLDDDDKFIIKLEKDLLDSNETTIHQTRSRGKPVKVSKEIKSRKIKKDREKVSKEDMFMRPRKNAALLMQHSTVLPFYYCKGYFHCFYCNKQFLNFCDLRGHTTDQHSGPTFETAVKSILRPRKIVTVDASEAACRQCETKCNSIQELVRHLTETHQVQFYSENGADPVNSVLPYVMKDGDFSCYECKKGFLFFKTLARHMNEHSTNHMCDVCGKCFYLEERLRSHRMYTHETGVNVKCDQCDKSFKSSLTLKSHVKYVHQRASYNCFECNLQFTSYKRKVAHAEAVHKRTPLNLKCKLCDKTCVSHNALNKHIRSHSSKPQEKKFPCQFCGKRFSTTYMKNNHELVHTGERNFECKVCNKKYPRIYTLKEHMKIHRNDRRWVCAACSQAFIQKCSLRQHIKTHHSDVDDREKLIVYNKPDQPIVGTEQYNPDTNSSIV